MQSISDYVLMCGSDIMSDGYTHFVRIVQTVYLTAPVKYLCLRTKSIFPRQQRSTFFIAKVQNILFVKT